MDRYPYHKPPRWWSPKASRFWMRLWRPWRVWQQKHDYKLLDIQVFGLEHVRQAIARRAGVLITPNHCNHADSYVLFTALERLPIPPQVMTAWQVFELLPWLQRLVYRHHGCFSVNREGNDLTAFRWSVNVLARSSTPLVVFPEGEVYHLADRVTPFRDGTLAMAQAAVRRGGRPVSCIPCAMRYFYLDDPTPELAEVLSRIETKLGLTNGCSPVLLAERIERLWPAIVAWREQQYQFARDDPADCRPLQARIDTLAAEIMRRVEARHAIRPGSDFLPERVKMIRHRVVDLMESLPRDDARRGALSQDLEDAFVAVQLFSYQVDYVSERPTIERIAETIDKLEEDVLGVRTATIRGRRRATITFGEPLVLTAAEIHADRETLGEELRRRVQFLIDRQLHQDAG